jgi:hypothetical protein
MKRVVLVYGLIAGAIVAALMIISQIFWRYGVINFDNGEYYGYGSMIVALSMVFFGIKSYRDNQQDGSVGFWKAVQIGLLISLLGAVVYAGSWEVYYQSSPEFRNTFFDKYTEHQVDKLQKGRASAEIIEEARAQIAMMRDLYQNPALRFGFSMVEILPVGVIVTLISAGILRRKDVLSD